MESTSTCYSNTRTCIKYANSVDADQTPDQRTLMGTLVIYLPNVRSRSTNYWYRNGKLRTSLFTEMVIV